MATSPNAVAHSSRELMEVLERMADNLTKASDKNDALLEAIETSEARAMDASASDVTLLKNLRARLAASHTPNAQLKKDLSAFKGEFEKRFADLNMTLKLYRDLNLKLQQEMKDADDQLDQLNKDRRQFEEEREEWKRHLQQAQMEITEQNDRLALLSQQLSGTKQDLETKCNELASRRIAFEEEKMLRESKETTAANGEAENLRKKLRDQALKNVQLENALLQTEVNLHQKEDEILKLKQSNNRLTNEVDQLRSQSSKAIKLFEKRTIEANKQLAYMNSELTKAQDNSTRFQELLMNERRKQKALQHALDKKATETSRPEIVTATAQKAYIETLTETLQNIGKKPHTAMRMEDVVRKNEVILIENASLKAEIQKLRIENTDLMKHVRFADCNAKYMRV
jgi:chromosome segregation ATPase